MNKIIKELTPAEREAVKTDSELQLAIAKDIGVSIQTVYQWALYRPEKLASKPAALRIIAKYLK